MRSWLYAPGHRPELLGKVFDAGADAVILDLEDAVPAAEKPQARERVAAALEGRTAWVRINAPGTVEAAADLAAIAGRATGVRVPKVESAADVAWIADRAPGTPLTCVIESAVGVTAMREIATAPQVTALALGASDLARDLGCGDCRSSLLLVRSQMVVTSRAAGLAPPIDSVHVALHDDPGLRSAAEHARDLGFFGKSAVHPRQVAIINDVFTPTSEHVAQARTIVEAFESAGAGAAAMPDGGFVDLAVANRARRLLALAERLA